MDFLARSQRHCLKLIILTLRFFSERTIGTDGLYRSINNCVVGRDYRSMIFGGGPQVKRPKADGPTSELKGTSASVTATDSLQNLFYQVCNMEKNSINIIDSCTRPTEQ